eukprot:Lithocolla_globosa_v1_NODE_84_length_6699_cov_54.834938.p7 type:complete len:147 gc:universal NODE_84_length_6699_cov_54.834938:1273-833(-)
MVKRWESFLGEGTSFEPANNGKTKKDQDGNVCYGPAGPRGGKGKPLHKYRKGDIIPMDLFSFGTTGLDGKLYADMWCGEGKQTGLVRQLVQYGGIDEVQEDGAPGHGFNNKKDGRPSTREHDRFEETTRKSNIEIYRRSANVRCCS